MAGSSPHTRGAPPTPPAPSAPFGIIPAYAGSTPKAAPRTPTRPDHPRIRGEHLQREAHATASVGSSPHTRGAPKGTVTETRESRIIPAYAGSTVSVGYDRTQSWDHPRIRGEHVDDSWVTGAAAGSSPHTRGAHPPCPRVRRFRRIIPAYAGSTALARVSSRHMPDHPRIRGEHVAPHGATILEPGSSPHTRGALLDKVKALAELRIIPAYAGSTRVRAR